MGISGKLIKHNQTTSQLGYSMLFHCLPLHIAGAVPLQRSWLWWRSPPSWPSPMSRPAAPWSGTSHRSSSRDFAPSPPRPRRKPSPDGNRMEIGWKSDGNRMEMMIDDDMWWTFWGQEGDKTTKNRWSVMGEVWGVNTIEVWKITSTILDSRHINHIWFISYLKQVPNNPNTR